MSGKQWICFDPDRPSGWTDDEFASFVASHEWVFARTMPDNPHEYTLRRNSAPEHFENAVRYIREFGEIETFAGRPYKVLIRSGYKYWTMGAVLSETILINRKLV